MKKNKLTKADLAKYKKSRDLWMIPIQLLKDLRLPCNPPTRTSPKTQANSDLYESLNERGFDPAKPLLLGIDLFIGDGGRRLEQALKLYLGGDMRFEFIPCIVDPKRSSIDIFMSENGLSMKFNGRLWVEAVAKGASVSQVLDSKVRREIEILQEIGLFDAVAEKGLSPRLVGSAKTLVNKIPVEDKQVWDDQFQARRGHNILWCVVEYFTRYSAQDPVSKWVMYDKESGVDFVLTQIMLDKPISYPKLRAVSMENG